MTVLTGIITILLSCFIYFFTSQYIRNDFFQRMKVRAGVAGQANFSDNGHNVSFYNEIRDKHLQRLPEETEYIMKMPASASVVDSLKLSQTFIQEVQRKGSARLREDGIYYFGTIYEHEKEKYVIVLSAFNQVGSRLLRNLRINLLVGFALSITIVYFLSYVFSKEVVSPIRHMIDNARKISASNLHLRLPGREGKGEMAALSQTFNDMLDRLETSFETQNNFISRAAHELRTPLTAISGEAELALAKQRSADEYVKALNIIAVQADQLQHHTSSLLELAQAGYNSKEPFMMHVRMDELLFAVKRLLDFTEPGNQILVDLSKLPDQEDQITISGNANLLKLALTNIVQNACKYSNNQPVEISISTIWPNCIITVKDNGIGIPEKELKYIFDPFFRASNTNPFKGYGIGLPLAQKIVRLHRGQLDYSSRQNEGTTVRMILPVASAPH